MNQLDRIENWIERRLLTRLREIEQKVKSIHMTMGNLENLVSEINAAVAVVSTEVNDLISRLQNVGAGGLTAAEASQLASDLASSLSKIQAISPEPAA